MGGLPYRNHPLGRKAMGSTEGHLRPKIPNDALKPRNSLPASGGCVPVLRVRETRGGVMCFSRGSGSSHTDTHFVRPKAKENQALEVLPLA